MKDTRAQVLKVNNRGRIPSIGGRPGQYLKRALTKQSIGDVPIRPETVLQSEAKVYEW
jgi:hypothetical protein